MNTQDIIQRLLTSEYCVFALNDTWVSPNCLLRKVTKTKYMYVPRVLSNVDISVTKQKELK